jgi:NAD(P)-dependent dehydrogenase (short-subunit alcohol dehydrogenase family)
MGGTHGLESKGTEGNEMQRFTDKVILITGAAEGMGRAITLAFAGEGAIVAATDSNTKLLEKTAKEASELSGRPVDGFKMDVTKKDEIAQTVKAIIDKHGRIDVLVNNAGVSTMNPVVDMTEEEWDFCMNVNAKGTFLVTKAVLPHMIAAKNGKIVNTASVAGKGATAFQAHYGASKAAVIAFTQALSKEVGEHHINVNAVCPGIIKTAMQDREMVWEGKLRGMKPEDLLFMATQFIPWGRNGEPEDVAKVILFLASPDAEYITGQAINITGGLIMVTH